MLPIPSLLAVEAFLGAALLLVIGVATASPPLIAMGGAMLGALALALTAAMPLGRRVRRERLELAWWFEHDGPGGGTIGQAVVVPGSPFRVRCYLRNRGPSELTVERVAPLVSHTALVEKRPEGLIIVPPRRRVEFAFILNAPAVGR